VHSQPAFRILICLLAGCALLALAGWVWPSYFGPPAGLLVFLPILSLYFFHKIGVPGLLEHNGLCGWGWCAPTAFGWVFLAVFWLLMALLTAWGIAALWVRISRRKNPSA